MDSVTIGIICGIGGIVFSWLAFSRTSKKDAEDGGRESAQIRTDIEYIKRGVDDIKLEQRTMRNDIDALKEKVLVIGLDASRANSRIDEMQHKDEHIKES